MIAWLPRSLPFFWWTVRGNRRVYIMVRIEVLDKIVIEFVNKRCAPVHLRCSTGSEGFTIGCFNLARIDLGYYFHRPGVPALFYAIKCSLKKVERLHVAHESWPHLMSSSSKYICIYICIYILFLFNIWKKKYISLVTCSCFFKQILTIFSIAISLDSFLTCSRLPAAPPLSLS